LLWIILYIADRFEFQRIEGAGCGLYPPRGDMQVARGGLDIGMPKQNLDRAWL
jgi:hypothetical protein